MDVYGCSYGLWAAMSSLNIIRQLKPAAPKEAGWLAIRHVTGRCR